MPTPRTLPRAPPGRALEIDLDLLRQDDLAPSVNLPLTLAVDGVRTADTIQIEGDSAALHQAPPAARDTDDGYGWASIPADGNPRDNVAFFAFGPSPGQSTSCMVADLDGEAVDSLLLAAAPPGFAEQKVTLCPGRGRLVEVGRTRPP